MIVTGKRKAPAHKPNVKPAKARAHTYQAPVRGWSLEENLAAPIPGTARLLDNWICTTSGARVRGGCTRRASTGAPVRSLMTYRSTAEKLFAATATSIFDATSPADPATPEVAVVTGLTSGDFVCTQFGTAGGDFLLCVNGSDDLQMYDGAAWSVINAGSSPGITGVLTSDLSHVWSHGSRVWFIEKDSLDAWYLPPASIGGAAVKYPLAGQFSLGGKLIFGARWSLDAGDGLDDKCVFVTDQGEVAVFEGSDPASASTWGKVGVYRLPRPMGAKALTQAGGDLLIATDSGLVPLSAALNTDIGAMEGIAVSRPIQKHWLDRASLLASKSWEMAKDPNAGVLVISQPDPTGALKECLLINLSTGGWSRATGWDVLCLAEFEGRAFFGSDDGGVYLVDEGGSDDGETYTSTYVGQFEALGLYGQQKSLRQMRALFQTSSAISPHVMALSDYDMSLPSPPAISPAGTGDVWGAAIWGEAIWGNRAATSASAEWRSVGATGATIAPVVQISFQDAIKPQAELMAIDVQFFAGAVVA